MKLLLDFYSSCYIVQVTWDLWIALLIRELHNCALMLLFLHKTISRICIFNCDSGLVFWTFLWEVLSVFWHCCKGFAILWKSCWIFWQLCDHCWNCISLVTVSRHSRSVNCFLIREFHDLVLLLLFAHESHVLSNYCDSGLVFLSIVIRDLNLCSCIVARVLQTWAKSCWIWWKLCKHFWNCIPVITL